MDLPHFTNKELACPFTGEAKLADGFGEALEALRVAYANSMPLTSCCRSPAHNTRIGGHPRSLHLIGNLTHGTDTCAVDVRMSDSALRAELIAKALEMGWSVGVASNFLHLDLRTAYTELPQVLYHYKR